MYLNPSGKSEKQNEFHDPGKRTTQDQRNMWTEEGYEAEYGRPHRIPTPEPVEKTSM